MKGLTNVHFHGFGFTKNPFEGMVMRQFCTNINGSLMRLPRLRICLISKLSPLNEDV